MNLESMDNADLLAMLVGRQLARSLAGRPLAEIFGYCRPQQPALGEQPVPYVAHPAIGAAKELFTRLLQVIL